MSQADDYAVVDHAKQTADPLDAGVSNHIFVCIVSSDAELKKKMASNRRLSVGNRHMQHTV